MSFEIITDFSITHHTPSFINTSFATSQLVEEIKNKLKTDSTVNLEIPLNQALELVEQLAEFDLGRFLLHNRSINGYWTAYIFRNQPKPNRHPLEEWL